MNDGCPRFDDDGDLIVVAITEPVEGHVEERLELTNACKARPLAAGHLSCRGHQRSSNMRSLHHET